MRAQIKRVMRLRRHGRVRKKVSGTADRPRLAVYRSNRHIYAQLIDDQGARTLASASDLDQSEGAKSARAKKVGQTLAERAKAAGIARAVFDRGGHLYHGRVQALADGAREGGLEI